MDFAMLTPEINSGRMYAGPGPGPMLAAAAAWDGLGAELRSAAASYASVISELTAGPWLGPSSVSMAAAAAANTAWMNATAAQVEQTAAQAKMAAAAYETAFADTVPPPVIGANRSLLATLVATNILGQNTPAIAATEAEYAEMWAQDAGAMYGYAGASASATALTPFTPPPQSTNPGGLGGQAAALTQATGTSAATNAQTVLSQLTSAVPTALKGLASPLPSTSAAAASTSGLLGILQSLGLTSPLAYFSPAGAGVSSAGLSTSAGAWASASHADAAILGTGYQIAAMDGRIMDRLGQLGSAGSAGLGTGGGSAALTASLGRAASVGALSVPPGWIAAAPALRLAAVALPETSLCAAPEVFAGCPGSLFSEMALASMAGRAIGNPVSPGHRERIGATTRVRPAPSSRSPGSPMTGLAEVRERAELLCKLGVLRDSGILTIEEFNEQKRCLLGG
jgi:PPE-repeat protein